MKSKRARLLSLLLCLVLICSNGAVQIAAAEPGTAGEAQVNGLTEEPDGGSAPGVDGPQMDGDITDRTEPVITVTPKDAAHVYQRGNIDYYCEGPTVTVTDERLETVTVKVAGKGEPQNVQSGTHTIDLDGQKGLIRIEASDGTNTSFVEFRISHGAVDTLRPLLNAPATCAEQELIVMSCGFCNLCGEYASEYEIRWSRGSGLAKALPHTFDEETVISAELLTACGESASGNVTKKTCSKCGYVEMTGADGEKFEVKGSGHQWVHKREMEPTCAQGVYEYDQCETCGAVKGMKLIGAVAHSFGKYEVTTQPDCQNHTEGEKTATCSVCKTKLTMKVSGNHNYVTKQEPAPTCTETGKLVRKCEYCGEKDPYFREQTIPALGHDFAAVGDDCTKELQCTRCQEKKDGSSAHSLEYRSNGTQHWQECTNKGCAHTESPEDHTFSGEADDCTKVRECTVCKYSETKVYDSHNYGQWKVAAADDSEHAVYHYRECTNPGCKQIDKQLHVVDESARNDCTKELKCSVCNTVLREKKAEHTLEYRHTIGGHWQECVADGCDYRTVQTDHNVNYDIKDCTKNIGCSECGYIVFHGNLNHRFTNSAYYDGGAEGHYQICQNKKCEEHSAPVPHTGGTATCTDKAVCTVCLAPYGELNKTNHTGGTEVVGHKDATRTEDGYTGDTVCLGCREIIKEGEAIPSLQKSCKHEQMEQKFDDTKSWYECKDCGHTERYVDHKLSEYQKNATGHWKYCETCEYKTSVSDHVLDTEHVDQDCTTAEHCKDCSYVMIEAKEHVYGQKYNISDTGHYRVCTNANCEVAEEEQKHDAVDDGDCTTAVLCKVCGYQIGGAEPAHNYPSTWESDGSEHYHRCENPYCEQEERAAHDNVVDDGNCTTPVVCLTCQHVIKEGKADHSFGGDYIITETGHYQKCQNPDCTQVSGEETHYGGVATCISKAFCQVCGAPHGEIDPDNHVNKELQDHKDPTTEEEGYSGNMVCKDCGEIVSYGQVLDKLPSEYEHHFILDGADDTHHWKECACGTIDPNSYKEHTFGDWETDVNKHWHTCTECGKTVEGEHVMENGSCTVCGHTAGHVHSLQWDCGWGNHWQVCSDCGERINESAHAFENGVCTVCGAGERVRGNVNGDSDGKVTVSDVLSILKYIVGNTTFDLSQKHAADVNNDGEVDIRDALLVAKKIAGAISEFTDEVL